MGMQEVQLTIHPDGRVEIKTSGFTGGECLNATAELERLLGGEVLERGLTDEYYQQQESQASDQLWNQSWG